MGSFVTVAAIDAVVGGNEITLPDTPVELRDASTGYDGPGSYHIQLVGGSSIRKYKVTVGLPPADSGTLHTIARVVVTPTGQTIYKDARKLNVGMTGVNATILQSPVDGSYLADDVVVPRNIKGGLTALLDTIGATQGDVLYRGATAWEALPPGTSGFVLTTGGASADPSWMAGGGGGTPVVPEGTSFPGSPTTWQLFWRTDLSALFVYNGTAWKNADSLVQLNDVAISSPANGDVLTYDSGTSTWKNAAPSGGSGVTSLESLTGALGITSPDGSVSIGTSGSDITLEATGGGGGGAGDIYDWSQGFPALSGWTQFGIAGTTSVVTNGTKSITVTDTGANSASLRGMMIPVPSSTPYRVAICLQVSGMSDAWESAFYGFSDGTKFDIFRWQYNANSYEQWSSATSRAAFGGRTGPFGPFLFPVWFGLRDDGTNFIFEYSVDGANFRNLWWNSKSSGYLGSSGYAYIAWGLIPDSFNTSGGPTLNAIACSMRCYDPNGLSRVVG